MTARTDMRKQVMAHIVSAMAKADAAGEDAFRAGRRMFPDVPIEIIAMASVDVEDAKTEAWWQSVEKTIDGEIIRRAIESPR